jgi:hypothetical protein
MQIRQFVRNSVCKCFIGYKMMRESTFHVSGKVSTHNCRIWVTKTPHVSLEHVRDSPKVNVFSSLSKELVYGPFFFMEMIITGIVYLDMLQQFLIPQLDGMTKTHAFTSRKPAPPPPPPHYLREVRELVDW